MKTKFILTKICLLAFYALPICAQNLYVSSDTTIYDFAPNGSYSTFATVPGDATGLAFDSSGNLFVPAASGVGKIFEIAPNGTQTTFASGLNTPTVLAFNSTGNLFAADMGNGSDGNIYEYTPNGVRSTFASGISVIYGLAFNSAGDLFAVNNSTIYEYAPNGTRSVFATVPGEGLGGLAFNSAGDLFVAVGGTTGYIDEFTPNGVRSTFASGLDEPLSLAFNNAGNLFVSELGPPYIAEFTPNGTQTTFNSTVGAVGLAFQGESLPVPEPSTLALLTVGAAILVLRRKILPHLKKQD